MLNEWPKQCAEQLQENTDPDAPIDPSTGAPYAPFMLDVTFDKDAGPVSHPFMTPSGNIAQVFLQHYEGTLRFFTVFPDGYHYFTTRDFLDYNYPHVSGFYGDGNPPQFPSRPSQEQLIVWLKKDEPHWYCYPDNGDGAGGRRLVYKEVEWAWNFVSASDSETGEAYGFFSSEYGRSTIFPLPGWESDPGTTWNLWSYFELFWDVAPYSPLLCAGSIVPLLLPLAITVGAISASGVFAPGIINTWRRRTR